MLQQKVFDGEVHVRIGGERLVDLMSGGLATGELGELVGGE